MKAIIGLAFLTLPLNAQAQGKHSIFADAGYNSSYGSPGGSITYSRKVAPRLGIGAGVQVFNDANISRVKKAAYLDLRAYWPVRKSLLFTMVDAGANFYRGYSTAFTEIPGRSFFSAFGFGYGYMINKRGMGPYASIKFQSDAYTSKGYSSAMPGYESKVQTLEGAFVLSAGFKF